MDNTLYTNEVRNFIRSQPWPVMLEWEVVEYEEFLQFRLFRDNLNILSDDDKLHAAKLVNEIMAGIRKNGIPIYTEIAKGSINGA